MNFVLNLYITRHGETIWNTEKRLQGWKDSALTENGVENAKLLGERLKDTEFDMIYASPSTRARMTAELIKGDRELIIREEENLREINLGEWEGRTHNDLEEAYPEEYHAFWNTPHLYKTKSGEDFYQLQARVKKVLTRIMGEHKDGNVLLVTHSVFIKALLAHCKNAPIEQLWAPPFIHDTSLTIIEVNNGKVDIKLEGDISHRSDAH